MWPWAAEGGGVMPELFFEGVGGEDDDGAGGELGGGGAGDDWEAVAYRVFLEAGVVVDKADELVAAGFPEGLVHEEASGVAAGTVEVEADGSGWEGIETAEEARRSEGGGGEGRRGFRGRGGSGGGRWCRRRGRWRGGCVRCGWEGARGGWGCFWGTSGR